MEFPQGLRENELVHDGFMTSDLSWEDSVHYCVCFADIVDSTGLAVRIRQPDGVRRFYSAYINTLSNVIRMFNSIIVKNTGDCLIYYFPATCDTSRADAFREVLDCGFTILAARPELNKALRSMNLPQMEYRISCDYGQLEVGRFSSTQSTDLFGSTMNICAKINCMAEPNTIVVGGDLYEILRSHRLPEYGFHSKGAYPLGLPREYPVYSVTEKRGSAANAVTISEQDYSGQILRAGIKREPYERTTSSSRTIDRPPKIMIVDDEPDILMTFKAFLQREGFQIETFDAPHAALERFTECLDTTERFDLAILDIRMPDVNGLQLHQRMRRLNNKIKTIFVSGLDAGRELVSVLPEPDRIDLINKPVNLEIFSQRVKSILGEP